MGRGEEEWTRGKRGRSPGEKVRKEMLHPAGLERILYVLSVTCRSGLIIAREAKSQQNVSWACVCVCKQETNAWEREKVKLQPGSAAQKMTIKQIHKQRKEWVWKVSCSFLRCSGGHCSTSSQLSSTHSATHRFYMSWQKPKTSWLLLKTVLQWRNHSDHNVLIKVKEWFLLKGNRSYSTTASYTHYCIGVVPMQIPLDWYLYLAGANILQIHPKPQISTVCCLLVRAPQTLARLWCDGCVQKSNASKTTKAAIRYILPAGAGAAIVCLSTRKWSVVDTDINQYFFIAIQFCSVLCDFALSCGGWEGQAGDDG